MRYLYLYAFLAISHIPGTPLSAQCPITVNAGEDIWICSPPASAQLDGSIDGDFVNFNWSPTTGMSGSNTLTPTVTVSQTTTYTLTAKSSDIGNNAIVNGDFEGGNFGFSSDYAYNPGFTGPPWGSYEVTTTPTIFPDCGDHTSGSGTYMVVDGADVPGLLVWCQTVAVTPNTDYVLSAWAVSFTNAGPFASLQFTVNGSAVGGLFPVPGPACSWRHFAAVWNSGSNSSATICIEDLTVTGANNDFALDDISLSPLCEATDSVTVHTVSLAAAAAPAVSILPCEGATVTLSGAGSSAGSDISYEWDGPGIVSGQNTLNPVVNAGGVYTLTVTLNNGTVSCTKTASVTVIDNPNPLATWIDPPAPLGCGASTVTLFGHTNQPGFSTYQWTAGPGGNIVSGQGNPIATVNQPGDYTLLITNTNTGCTAEATVTVLTDTNLPVAQSNASGSISCQQPLVSLSGAGSSTGNNITYTWSTLVGGNIVSGQTTQNAVVNGAGTYVLTVVNTTNQCIATDTVVVTSTSTPPQISIDSAGVFTCLIDTMELSVNISPPGATVFWTASSGGAIVSGADSPTPLITGSGAYFLTATDTTNGCSVTDSITVSVDKVPPLVVLQAADTLTCQLTSTMLSGNGSSAGAGFVYTWIASNGGNISSGADSLTPLVDAPGTYTLIIANIINGCTATGSATVTEITDPPPVNAGSDGLITCYAPTTILTADTTASLFYTWYTPDGNLVSNPDSSSVRCDLPGHYILTVTNPLNGCLAKDTALVLANQSPPDVGIVPAALLTCTQTTATINLSGGEPTFVYQWQTSNGHFISGQNSDTPLVNQPGQYTLLVTDTINGCTASLSTTIDQDTLSPAVSVSPAATLTCDLTQVTLIAAIDSSLANEVAWTTINGGNILSGENTTTPVVDQPGAYIITATNTTNGCTNTASATVQQNTAAPTVEAGPDTSLNCLINTVSLQGSGAATGIPDFAWMASGGGNILSGDTTPTPLIDAPGTYTLVVTDQQNSCTASDTVTVLQDANTPLAAIAPAGLLTCSITQIALQGDASTGPSFTFQWTAAGGGNIVGGDHTLSPMVDRPGIYILTVTNTQSGCTATAQSTVNQDITPPQIAIAPPGTLSCVTTSLTLSASPAGPGLSFDWQTTNGSIVSGSNTSTPIVNIAGDYTLTLTRLDNGCTATASVTVAIDTLHPVLSTSIPPTLSCVLKQISLEGTVFPPAGNYAINWTTPDGHFVSGQNTLTPVADAPGNYTLMVQDQQNGCSSSVAIMVLQNTEPPVANTGPTPVLTCAQPEANLDASASSGMGILGFEWAGGHITSGANTATPRVSAPGTYILTLTDVLNGCTATTSVTVGLDTSAPLAIIAPPPLRTCTQPSVSLNATASSSGPIFSLSWTTANGHFTSGQNTLTPSVDAAGQYTLTMVNQQNGCSATASVTVGEDLTPPLAEAGPPDQLYCLHPTATLQGSSNTPGTLVFSWSTADGHFTTPTNIPAPQVNAPGTYMLTVTNSTNGCTATDQVTISRIPPPVFVPTLTQPNCKQPAGAITFIGQSGGTPPFVFSIDGGQTVQSAPTFNNLIPGQYNLVLLDANGCSADTSVNILPAVFPSVDLQDLQLIALGDSALLQPATNPPASQIAGWQWTPATGLSCADCANPWARPQQSTTYSLVITDQNGCTAEDRVDIRVDRRHLIYAPNAFSPNGDGENDVFLLFGKAVVELRSLRIFNRWGELVFENKHIPANTETAGWDGSFRGQHAPPGVYVWQAKVAFMDGEEEVFAGDVTVIR